MRSKMLMRNRVKKLNVRKNRKSKIILKGGKYGRGMTKKKGGAVPPLVKTRLWVLGIPRESLMDSVASSIFLLASSPIS